MSGMWTFLPDSRTSFPRRRSKSCEETVCLLPSKGQPLAARRHPVAAAVGDPWESERSLHSCSCSEARQGYFRLDGVHGDDCPARAAYSVLLFRILFSLSFSSVPYNYSNKGGSGKGGRRTWLHLIFSPQITGDNILCISIGILHIKIPQNKE